MSPDCIACQHSVADGSDGICNPCRATVAHMTTALLAQAVARADEDATSEIESWCGQREVGGAWWYDLADFDCEPEFIERAAGYLRERGLIQDHSCERGLVRLLFSQDAV